MRIFLHIVAIALLLVIYLVSAVNNDKKWFHNFSKNQQDTVGKTTAIIFDRPAIDKVAKLAMIEPPPPVINMTVYFTSSDQKIISTRIPYLKQVYFLAYTSRFQNLANFLFEVLNQRLKLNPADSSVRLYCESIFKVDSTISSIYKEAGLAGLINEYTVADSNLYILKSTELSVIQINSISYYFFINRFMQWNDDYGGTIQFRRLSLASAGSKPAIIKAGKSQ